MDGLKFAYSIAEFAQLTGLGKTKIFEEIKNGKLVARKTGRRTIILSEECQRYLSALPVAAGSR